MALVQFQGIWFDPDSMHQRLLGEIERQKQIYAELLTQNHDIALERIEAEKQRDALVDAARQAYRALLEREPHSVPGGEEACEALRAALALLP